MGTMRSLRRFLSMAMAASVVALGLSTATATAGPQACDTRVNNTFEKLLECVTVDGVRQHQAAFQAAADANGGTREASSAGYFESVDYIVDQMEAAGYDVTVQSVGYSFFEVQGTPLFAQVNPVATDYVDGVDFDVMRFSGAGDTGAVAVTPVNLSLADPGASVSGCDSADFAGFAAGTIALMQRGACSFADKANNAEAAGAVGAIIFNQGNSPDREGVLFGTLGEPGANIPVVGATFAVGADLASGSTAALDISTVSETRTSANVIADSRSGNPDNVVMVGAHLDSVAEGPGIQDNGSGSAAILEVALQMAKVTPRNQLRFAWWGAEEAGLVGSDTYVFGLAQEELDKISLYLNFDMIGSPNFVRFVYDGDGSAFGLQGPPGSEAIEAFFEDFYGERGLASEPTEISFRSDYAAFFDSGIPFGGLFTGAEGIKTPEQVALYGGTAGEQYDPCYHLACDTFDNISLEVLDLNADAVAASTLQYAMNTEAVNGEKGKGNFRPEAIPTS